jgi:hypothetical protein
MGNSCSRCARARYSGTGGPATLVTTSFTDRCRQGHMRVNGGDSAGQRCRAECRPQLKHRCGWSRRGLNPCGHLSSYTRGAVGAAASGFGVSATAGAARSVSRPRTDADRDRLRSAACAASHWAADRFTQTLISTLSILGRATAQFNQARLTPGCTCSGDRQRAIDTRE